MAWARLIFETADVMWANPLLRRCSMAAARKLQASYRSMIAELLEDCRRAAIELLGSYCMATISSEVMAV